MSLKVDVMQVNRAGVGAVGTAILGIVSFGERLAGIVEFKLSMH
jgi:multidrug transporter EmrE-like cation transporter